MGVVAGDVTAPGRRAGSPTGASARNWRPTGRGARDGVPWSAARWSRSPGWPPPSCNSRFLLVFYAFSVWHALILGVDVGYYTWLRPLIWLAQIPLLALLIRRLLLPMRTGTPAARHPASHRPSHRYTLIAASSLNIMLIAGIVVTGHSGFIATV